MEKRSDGRGIGDCVVCRGDGLRVLLRKEKLILGIHPNTSNQADNTAGLGGPAFNAILPSPTGTMTGTPVIDNDTSVIASWSLVD